MIRRTRRGDIITIRHTHSTKPWFHFPVGTPMERITVTTAPMVSQEERQRLTLIQGVHRTGGEW